MTMNANELAEELLAVVNVSSHVKMCASDMLRRQQAEIEEWKRKYKDMHNLATQAMSRVHELEKENTSLNDFISQLEST